MNDLTQQRIAEYEAYLIDLLEKLKVPEPPYTQSRRFRNRTSIKMKDLGGAEEVGIDYLRLKSAMKQLTDQYIRKLV